MCWCRQHFSEKTLPWEFSLSMEELDHTLLKGILSARKLPTATTTVVWSFAFLRHWRSNMTRSLLSICSWLKTDIRMRTINTQLSGQAHKIGRMSTVETFTKHDPHSFRHPQFPILSTTKQTQREQKLAWCAGDDAGKAMCELKRRRWKKRKTKKKKKFKYVKLPA